MADIWVQNGKRALAAVIFSQQATLAMDVYSSVHSSPFTVSQVAGDEQKRDDCKNYIKHAMIISSLYGITAAIIAGWPLGFYAILGTAVSEAYMFKLYDDAMKTAMERGSVEMKWHNK